MRLVEHNAWCDEVLLLLGLGHTTVFYTARVWSLFINSTMHCCVFNGCASYGRVRMCECSVCVFVSSVAHVQQNAHMHSVREYAWYFFVNAYPSAEFNIALPLMFIEGIFFLIFRFSNYNIKPNLSRKYWCCCRELYQQKKWLNLFLCRFANKNASNVLNGKYIFIFRDKSISNHIYYLLVNCVLCRACSELIVSQYHHMLLTQNYYIHRSVWLRAHLPVDHPLFFVSVYSRKKRENWMKTNFNDADRIW